MRQTSPCLAIVVTFVFAPSLLAEDVIQEHIKAIGGADAIAKVKTIKRSGTVAMEGGFGNFKGEIEEVYDTPNQKGYQKVNLQVFAQETGFTGKTGWKKSAQQGISDMSEQELGMAKLSLGVSPIATLHAAYGAEAFEDGGEKEFHGKKCAVLNVAGSPIVFYVNQETKLLEGLELPGMLDQVLSDYEEIGGVQIAKKSVMKVTSGGMTFTSAFDKVDVNVDLDDSIFERPDN